MVSTLCEMLQNASDCGWRGAGSFQSRSQRPKNTKVFYKISSNHIPKKACGGVLLMNINCPVVGEQGRPSVYYYGSKPIKHEV